MRDQTRIRYARNWLDRRIIWAKNNAAVTKGNSSHAAAILAKQAEAEARTLDMNHRICEGIEYKRELAELSKMLKQMEGEREQRRQDYRRQLVSDELVRMAEYQLSIAESSNQNPEESSSAMRVTRSQDSGDRATTMLELREALKDHHPDLPSPAFGVKGSAGYFRKSPKGLPSRKVTDPFVPRCQSTPTLSNTGAPDVKGWQEGRIDWSRLGADTLTPSASYGNSLENKTLKMGLITTGNLRGRA